MPSPKQVTEKALSKKCRTSHIGMHFHQKKNASPHNLWNKQQCIREACTDYPHITVQCIYRVPTYHPYIFPTTPTTNHSTPPYTSPFNTHYHPTSPSSTVTPHHHPTTTLTFSFTTITTPLHIRIPCNTHKHKPTGVILHNTQHSQQISTQQTFTPTLLQSKHNNLNNTHSSHQPPYTPHSTSQLPIYTFKLQKTPTSTSL